MPFPVRNTSFEYTPTWRQKTETPKEELLPFGGIKSVTTSSNKHCNNAAKRAIANIGIKEDTGNNDGKQIERYRYFNKKLEEAPWCASFFNWCYNPNHKPGENVLGMSDKHVPSTQAILKRAKEVGCFAPASIISTYTPHVGDGIVWTNIDDKNKGHIGIVVEVRSDGSFVTVQGNNNNQVERIEYKSVQEAFERGRTSSGGYAQRLQGFIQMDKYNDSHNLASTFNATDKNYENPDSDYNLMA